MVTNVDFPQPKLRREAATTSSILFEKIREKNKNIDKTKQNLSWTNHTRKARNRARITPIV